MTAEQKLERIKDLIKKYDYAEVTKDEFYNDFEKQRVVDIKEEMWELYCFMIDVIVTIDV